MLETDCIIPHHVPIPHREFYALHGTALSVRTLMSEGLGKWAIIKKLRISEDAYNEAVYEINKQKAVEEMNGRNQEVTDMKEDLREKVKSMLASGMKQSEIAQENGYSKGRISQIVKEIKSGKKDNGMQINEEFDNAVNQMIAESDKPEPVTQKNMLHSTEIPDDVLTAVRDAIDYEDETVEDHLRTIRELQHEIEQRRTKAAIMRKWLEDCGYESTAD